MTARPAARPTPRPSGMLRGPASATILAVTRGRRITVLEQEVFRLEQELAVIRQQLAEAQAALAAANATVDELIQGGLAVDRAADGFIDNLLGQVDVLQRDIDDRDTTLDRAGDEVASVIRENHAKDDRIEQLQLAMLGVVPVRRQ